LASQTATVNRELTSEVFWICREKTHDSNRLRTPLNIEVNFVVKLLEIVGGSKWTRFPLKNALRSLVSLRVTMTWRSKRLSGFVVIFFEFVVSFALESLVSN
jgi:hypothetical protein